MTYNKIMIASFMLISIFLLPGCHIPISDCYPDGNGGITCPLFTEIRPATYEKSATDLLAIDASKIAVDFSGSNVAIATAPTTVTISLKSNNITVAARVFPTQLSGMQLKLAQPQALEDWIAQNINNFDELTVDMSSIHFSRHTGENIIRLTTRYNGTAVSRSSYAHYENPDNCPTNSYNCVAF